MMKCEMTTEESDIAYGSVYFKCGKPAKYMTPKDPITNKTGFPVCGLHKNSVDAFFKRIGSNERCKPLQTPAESRKEGGE